MKVLFVCSGNAHRSPLAEALLRKMRPDLEVDSAGINTTVPISEQVRKYLTTQNADQHLKKNPESLYDKQLNKYDLIVNMEQLHEEYVLSKCPECESKTVLWNIKDPYFLSQERAQRVYNQIKDKVEELAESL